MKQYILLILACTTLGGVTNAATLSGTVSSNCGPVSGLKIHIRNALLTYADSTLTNSSGVYSFTLPTSLPTTTSDTLYIQHYYPGGGGGCGAQRQYTGANINNVNINCGNQYKSVQGTIALAGATNYWPTKVYLIRKKYDPVVMDTTLTAIDSATVGSISNPAFYSFSQVCLQADAVLLKAVLMPSHPLYSSYLPTYYTSMLNWNKAAKIPTPVGASITVNMSLTYGTNPGGPGFIGGSVLLGANKSAAVGDPLNNRILLLTTSAGQAVAYTYSSSTGQFSFPSLPYGTYNIFGDALGKTNPPLTVTISAGAPGVSNILFEENNKTFKGSIGTLGIGTNTALAGISVYPNPVTDYVQFNGLMNIAGSKAVVVRNITGAVVAREVFAPGAALRISTATLPSGMYLLRLQTEEGAASFRIVK